MIDNTLLAFENCSILGYNAPSSDNLLKTFSSNRSLLTFVRLGFTIRQFVVVTHI